MVSVCLHNWCNLEQTDILFLRQTENDFQTGDIQEFTGLWPGLDIWEFQNCTHFSDTDL